MTDFRRHRSILVVASGLVAGLVAWSSPALASRTLPVSPAPRQRPAVKPRAKRTRAQHKTVRLKTLRHVVEPGETLASVLTAQGLRWQEIAQWDAAIRRAAGNVQLTPQHVLMLRLSKPGQVATLSYEVDDTTRVVVQRKGTELQGRAEPLPIRIKVVGAQGVVEKNFYQAARRAEIPDRIVSQMADILGWEFDFRRVKAGDQFRVVYEKRISADGRTLAPGKVLAAEIRSPRHMAQGFYYEDGDHGTYVDGDGQTLAQSFLRYPVEFTRISSVFARQRFHPILKTARPHNGVDFAAPVGTPVRAAGDGVVSVAGRNGDYGNQVAVEHGEGLVTTYSHLNGIMRELRPGTTVRQGQVIGWVGQTGLTTGPHLHFALFREGKYLNPLTARVALRSEVRDQQRFQLAKQSLLRQLASAIQPPAAPIAAASAEPIVLAQLPLSRRLGIVTITR